MNCHVCVREATRLRPMWAEFCWIKAGEARERRRKRVPSQGKCFECHARMRVISKFITRTARVRRLEPSGTSPGLSTVNLQDPHGGAHAVIIGHQGCRRRSVSASERERAVRVCMPSFAKAAERVNYWRSKGEGARAALLPFPTCSAHTHPCSRRSDDLMETIADSCICNEIDCERESVDLLIFFFLLLTIPATHPRFFTAFDGEIVLILVCKNDITRF